MGQLTRAIDDLRGIGLGNEPQPVGTRIDPGSVRGYYVDLTAKTAASTATTPKTLPPAGLAQLALGWHERALEGDAVAAGCFDSLCTLLAERGIRREDGVRWAYVMAVPKYRVHPPWFSAMAQGLVASVFARAFLASGDDSWRALALDAIRPLLVKAESDLVSFTPRGPILEEVPGEPRAH